MLVSVIIPCYNVEAYIAECIESVINQTYKKIEIICINNNSNDNTLPKLNQLKIKYPNLIIDSEIRAGANAARNKGLLIANGVWLQFLDADDLLMPNKIAHQIKLIQDCQFDIAFVAGASKKRFLNGTEKVMDDLEENISTSPFLNKSGNTCSNLWHKKVLVSVGMWNENIKSSQEVDLMLKIALQYNQIIIDKSPYTVIRERISGQISQGNSSSKWKQFIDVRLAYLRKLEVTDHKVYLQFKGVFYDFLMVSLIELGKLKKEDAVEIFNNSIRKNWHSSGHYGFNRFKVIIIKAFGFRFFLDNINRI